jgi:hypothetical protein
MSPRDLARLSRPATPPEPGPSPNMGRSLRLIGWPDLEHFPPGIMSTPPCLGQGEEKLFFSMSES